MTTLREDLSRLAEEWERRARNTLILRRVPKQKILEKCAIDVRELLADPRIASHPESAPAPAEVCPSDGTAIGRATCDCGRPHGNVPPAAPAPGEDGPAGPTLDEIAEKADGYARHLSSPDALQGALEIVAQNVRDAARRARRSR